jgi:[ribosomal protein S18]-alanine N-acetyltransferase
MATNKPMPDHVKSPVRDEDGKQGCFFRESAAADETAIREILGEANLSFHASHDISSESDSPALAVIGATFVYLCELDGEVVAVLQWRHLGEEAEILDIAVPARHRRKGYARFLLKKFLHLAHERGAGKVFLEVRESNAAALALYSEFRFEVTGRRPNYYRDPTEAAVLLHLKITG